MAGKCALGCLGARWGRVVHRPYLSSRVPRGDDTLAYVALAFSHSAGSAPLKLLLPSRTSVEK